MRFVAEGLPRLLIEHVTPLVDEGRYPIKRTLGSQLEVGVNVFKDGHDLVAARILYRHEESEVWHASSLTYRDDLDRWFGSFFLDALGRYEYLVEAWPDLYGSFRADLEKRVKAAQDVRPELLDGAVLLLRLASYMTGEGADRVQAAAEVLRNASLSLDQRLETAFSEEVSGLVYGPIVPGEAAWMDPSLEVIVDRPLASFSSWYELFPRSEAKTPGVHGTLADTAQRLPELAALGFDVIYLPPIHPIGVTQRKGKNNSRLGEPGDVGSPWAIGSELGGHTTVHPELGTLADFEALVGAAQELGLEIALDYALQCSPDHPWVKQHPEWFYVRPDGSIRYAENPPKKYEDIYPLNFWCKDREGLWNACRDIILFWAAHGVRIFRVDNPHTKPFAFWEWLIRDVQYVHPDLILLSESFTRPNRMKALAKLGFSQSYTYFTWKNSAWELKEYLSELTQPELLEYFRPNFFANTPDILHEYLQTGGPPAFRVRLTLAATLAPVYGIYAGFELCENTPLRPGSEEYLHSEKYQIQSRDWNAPHNIKQDIAKLNRIRRENPALQQLGNLQFLHSDYQGILAYRKYAQNNELLMIVNLDPHHVHESMIEVPLDQMGMSEHDAYEVTDLLNGDRYVWRGSRNYVRLDPAERVAHILRVSRS